MGQGQPLAREVKQVWGLLEELWGLTHPSGDVVVLQNQVGAQLPLYRDTHGVQPVEGGIQRVLSGNGAPRLPSAAFLAQGTPAKGSSPPPQGPLALGASLQLLSSARAAPA